MKKYLSLLLALLFSVGILAGCAPHGNLAENTDTEQSRWPESTEFPPSDNSHKIYCNATMDSQFLGNYVSATLMPYASEKEYTPEDFPECEFTEIKREIHYPDNPEKRYVTLTLVLAHPSKENALEAVKLLEKRPDVYYARPDYYVKPEAAPTDNYYTNGTQNEFNIISLPQAWNLSVGSNSVTVGVIDSGIDADHPELNSRIDDTLSWACSSNYPADEDLIGHGTAVASIIGAETNNSGMSGICWNVKIASLNVWDGTRDSDGDPVYHLENIINAMGYAGSAGIKILNMSFGFYEYWPDFYNALRTYPGLIVCAAGNNGWNTDVSNLAHYPSAYQSINLISVGSSTDSDTRASGSNYGANTVELFAPGERIVCCDTETQWVNDNFSGTSFATPMVTGVAALVLAKYPNTSASQLKQIILNSVDPVVALESYCETGGRLNAYNAVRKHQHSFDTRYVSSGPSSHKAYCACTSYKVESHTFTTSGSTVVCTKCGYSSISLNNKIPGAEIE